MIRCGLVGCPQVACYFLAQLLRASLLLLNKKRYSNTRKSKKRNRKGLLSRASESLTLALNTSLVLSLTFVNDVTELLSLLYYLLGLLLTLKHLNLLHLVQICICNGPMQLLVSTSSPVSLDFFKRCMLA